MLVSSLVLLFLLEDKKIAFQAESLSSAAYLPVKSV